MQIIETSSVESFQVNEPAKSGKHYLFLSGLPRSGSTLLASLLNQNPAIHAGANSPMAGLMSNVEKALINSEQFNAYPKTHVVPGLVRGILESFYSDRNERFIIDKSRVWMMPDNFAMLKRCMPYEPKVIVVVRPIIEILASFLTLIHNNEGNVSFIDAEIQQTQYFNFYRHPDELRCDYIMRPKGGLDDALYGVAFACHPQNSQHVHFVEYEDLVTKAPETMAAIYKFLEIEPIEHDYLNIDNKFHERDETYGLYGMHDIRRRLSRSMINPVDVLPPYVIQKYSNMEFWRNRETLS